MGTKQSPSLFDCYEAADDNEERFTLVGRDPIAPDLVELWAAIRSGDAILAITLSSRLIVNHVAHYEHMPTQQEQIDEARHIADNMRQYAASLGRISR